MQIAVARNNNQYILEKQEDGTVKRVIKPQPLIPYTEEVTMPLFQNGKMVVGTDEYEWCGVKVLCKLVKYQVEKYKLNPLFIEYEKQPDGTFKTKRFDILPSGQRVELPSSDFNNSSASNPTNMQDARAMSILEQNKLLLKSNDELKTLVQQLLEAQKQKPEGEVIDLPKPDNNE